MLERANSAITQLILALFLLTVGYTLAFFVDYKSGLRRQRIQSLLSRFSGSLSSWLSGNRHGSAKEISGGESSGAPLYTKSEVEAVFSSKTWQRQAYEDFKAKVISRSKPFPCVYATMGFRSDDHRFVFLEGSNLAQPRNIRMLGPALQSYLRNSSKLGPNTSIVVMCAPADQELSVEQYNRNFWDALRGLRIWDRKSWPADVPHDIQDWKWSFCFDGEPAFPVSLNPAYVQRNSRRMAVHLIALQPKWVLDNLLSTPEKGQIAQDKVRKLLRVYDTTPVHPALKAYQDEEAVEAHMLGLPDDTTIPEVPYQSLDG